MGRRNLYLRQKMGLLSRESGCFKRKPADPFMWAPRNKGPNTDRRREGWGGEWEEREGKRRKRRVGLGRGVGEGREGGRC